VTPALNSASRKAYAVLNFSIPYQLTYTAIQPLQTGFPIPTLRA
jgi:hypothetical protein